MHLFYLWVEFIMTLLKFLKCSQTNSTVRHIFFPLCPPFLAFLFSLFRYLCEIYRSPQRTWKWIEILPLPSPRHEMQQISGNYGQCLILLLRRKVGHREVGGYSNTAVTCMSQRQRDYMHITGSSLFLCGEVGGGIMLLAAQIYSGENVFF